MAKMTAERAIEILALEKAAAALRLAIDRVKPHDCIGSQMRYNAKVTIDGIVDDFKAALAK